MSTHNVRFREEIRKILCLFVCVEVLWPSQPNGIMLNAVSLPNHFYWADLVLLILCTFSCTTLGSKLYLFKFEIKYGKEFRCLNTKGKYGKVTDTEIK